MHDLHVADKICHLVAEYAAKNKLNLVLRIVINLGVVIEHGASINPENLKFNVEMLNQGTIAENAEIIINQIEGGDWELVAIEGD